MVKRSQKVPSIVGSVSSSSTLPSYGSKNKKLHTMSGSSGNPADALSRSLKRPCHSSQPKRSWVQQILHRTNDCNRCNSLSPPRDYLTASERDTAHRVPTPSCKEVLSEDRTPFSLPSGMRTKLMDPQTAM